MAMKGDLGWIERKDSGDADEDDVGFDRMPVVGPCVDIHDRRIVLGHVSLADAANMVLPRLLGSHSDWQAGWQSDKIGGRWIGGCEGAMGGGGFVIGEDGA